MGGSKNIPDLRQLPCNRTRVAEDLIFKLIEEALAIDLKAKRSRGCVHVRTIDENCGAIRTALIFA